MANLRKEKIMTWLLEKSATVVSNASLSKHIPFENLCSRRVFPSARAEDTYTEKCVFFANAEKHIEAIFKKMVHKDISARQLRMDVSHLIEEVLVLNKKGFKGRKFICPIALFNLCLKAEFGMGIAVAECPFVNREGVVIERDFNKLFGKLLIKNTKNISDEDRLGKKLKKQRDEIRRGLLSKRKKRIKKFVSDM